MPRSLTALLAFTGTICHWRYLPPVLFVTGALADHGWPFMVMSHLRLAASKAITDGNRWENHYKPHGRTGGV
ncbi:MAG: hypothetical protein QF918_07370 [Pirellulaceae bacterium]|jgi:hypothetical protein|nr:hypothetical protein [Pirellulaceae bacterium]